MICSILPCSVSVSFCCAETLAGSTTRARAAPISVSRRPVIIVILLSSRAVHHRRSIAGEQQRRTRQGPPHADVISFGLSRNGGGQRANRSQPSLLRSASL